jgi:hypothetical protein
MTDAIKSLTSVEPFEGADEWIEAVAKRARQLPEEVRAELARQQIRPPAGWGPQRHLHLDGLLFAGVKTPRDAPPTPYIFDIQFQSGVTAFGTHNENDAGKSSVLKTLRWALRGRCQLQPDVRQWMRAIALELHIGDERLAVTFAVNDGEPTGAVVRLRQPINFEKLRAKLEKPTIELADPAKVGAGSQSNGVYAATAAYIQDDHAVEVAQFHSSEDFERVMGDVMLERLGFPRIPSWQNRPKSQQAHDGDGSLGELGWQTWSAALSITEPNVPVVLGEEQHAVVRILQMYLGSPWAVTVAAIAARKGQLSSQIGVLQRRLQDQRGAHTDDLTLLRSRLREIDAELSTQQDPVDLAELDRRIRAAADAGRTAAVTETAYREASLRYGEANRMLDDAESELAALQEAKLTRRFWHALKPSCCPRCDADVTEERWAREQAGQCSLCDNPLDLQDASAQSSTPAQDLDETTIERYLSEATTLDLDGIDDLAAAQLQVRQLERRLAVVDRERELARRAREEAQQAWHAAQAAVSDLPNSSVAHWQSLMVERAVTLARIEERENVRPTINLEQQIEELQHQVKIIKAAEQEAQKRHRDDQEDLLRMVSEQVARLGRTLGVRNLESVTLLGNGHMPVVKGGAKQNFGQLEPGEKLRLKIALMVALMRIGEEAGVARHPGLVVIDSLGREELNPINMIDMLREMVRLTEEVPYLQVVLTSAYGERLVEGLGEDRVLLARAGRPLW